MDLTHQPGVHRGPVRRSNAWFLAVVGALAVVVVLLVADGREGGPGSTTRGSGVPATERREVAPFAAVELAGTNAVAIRVGAPRSVEVTADDNLVGRVTTVVRDGRLVVDDRGSFTTKAAMHVVVSLPSLDHVVLSGDGAVTVHGVAGADFRAELTGDGTLVVTGSAERVLAVLAGDGTLDLRELVAVDAAAELRGTGMLRMHATATLDAALSGTGTIQYRGDPTVTVRNTGTGIVVPE